MTRPDVLRVLLVEDDPVDTALFRSLLGHGSSVEQHHCATLGDAVAFLAGETVDIVVLDLSLPDSAAPETYRRLAGAAPEVAVIVLTGTDDQAVAIQALSDGAQDYLVKSDVTEALLAKSVRYAIERQRAVRRHRRLRVHELEILASVSSGSGGEEGDASLGDRSPAAFDRLVTSYSSLLADEGRDPRGLGPGARALVMVAADEQATPADLAAVHAVALRAAPGAGDDDGSHLVLLGLVGELANEYRRRALAGSG